MNPNNARTYTREELLAILEKEGNGISVPSLRKAISHGLIPRPRLISAGRGKIRSEYSETALAHAQLLARLMHSGKSFQDFKQQIESLSVKGMAEVLDFIEHATRIYAATPTLVAKHAQLDLQELARANSNGSPEIKAWLSSLADGIPRLTRLPTHAQGKGWTAWLAETRRQLEERNAQLRSSTTGNVPDQRQNGAHTPADVQSCGRPTPGGTTT